MTNTPTPLPSDIETLQQLLASRDALIAKLLAEIARLKRWQFGRSSERIDETLAQLQLALGDLQSAPQTIAAPPEPTLPAKDSTQAPPDKKVLPFRRAPRAFPAHLPRETVVHAPASCDCPDCGSAMRPLGEDVSEMLDLVPATSRSSAMCDPSSPAATVRGWSSSRRRCGPSTAAWRPPACWRK